MGHCKNSCISCYKQKLCYRSMRDARRPSLPVLRSHLSHKLGRATYSTGSNHRDSQKYKKLDISKDKQLIGSKEEKEEETEKRSV